MTDQQIVSALRVCGSRFPEYNRGLYYRDQQQARVFCFCPICGGEMYNPDDDICWYCQQKGGADDGDIAD